jgi:hypothetical protein
VLLHRVAPEGEKGAKVFDSRLLTHGDLFALTLMRPGTYGVRDDLGAGRARVRVTQPAPGNGENWPTTPLHVAVLDDGFSRQEIEVHPAQPVIFEVGRQNAAVTIDLLASDEGSLAYLVVERGGSRVSLRSG